MTWLPIIARELRVMSRRPRTYWSRWSMVATVVVLGGWMLSLNLLIIRGGGRFVFNAIAFVLAWMAVLSGFAAADTISEEKREGTIGLLFLTGIRESGIVFGKFVASVVPAVSAALGALPIIAITLLLGGVGIAQVCLTALALLNLIFLSHAFAIAGSAFFRKRQNAAGFPFLCVVGYVLFTWVPSLIATAKGYTTLATGLTVLNPITPFLMATTLSTATSHSLFFSSLLVTQATGWLALGLAVLILPRCWQEKPSQSGAWRRWWESVRFGNLRRRAALHRQLMSRNPFLWLISRRHANPRTLWIAFVACLTAEIVIAILGVRHGDKWDDLFPPLSILTIAGGHLILCVAAAGFVGGALEEQRRNGGLEIVLSCTPLKMEDIFQGVWSAWRRWLWGPAVGLVALGILLAMITSGTLRGEDATYLVWFLLIASALLIPNMRASTWLAMWVGMSSRQKRPAAAGAAILVLIFPYIVVIPIELAYALLTHGDSFEPWILWPVLQLAIDYGFSRWSRWRLNKNFRRWAVPNYQPYLGFWGCVGKWLGDLVHSQRGSRWQVRR